MDISGHEGEIPDSITSTYVGGHGQNHGHSIFQDNPPLHLPTDGPTPLSPASRDDHPHPHSHPNNIRYNSKKGVVMKYKECLKNHAALIGGTATDGCGEFMPSGEEGTLEALKCSACSCHRNFHRREIEGEATSCECFHHFKRRKMVGQKGLLIPASDAFGYCSRPLSHHMIMPLGALQTSESDGMEGRPPIVKKRFRTKFTQEQKEKMLDFAEKAGWKLQKQEENVVQQLCQEIGVKRRVLKVWMHNNKHHLAKKSSIQLE